MKKMLCLLTAVLILLLSACGEAQPNKTDNTPGVKEEATQPAADTTEKEKDKEPAIEVDKGILNNEVTLPAAFFEGQDLEQVRADAKEQGIDDVTKNDDGTFTYKMSKSKYKEMQKTMEEGVLEYVEGLKKGVDFASIKDVTHNKSYSEFTLVVDKEAYENGFDGMASLGIVMVASYYQMFDGIAPDKTKITINVKDSVTEEIISTKVYPEDLE